MGCAADGGLRFLRVYDRLLDREMFRLKLRMRYLERLEFLELGEVRVRMLQIRVVAFGARRDEQVGRRN